MNDVMGLRWRGSKDRSGWDQTDTPFLPNSSLILGTNLPPRPITHSINKLFVSIPASIWGCPRMAFPPPSEAGRAWSVFRTTGHRADSKSGPGWPKRGEQEVRGGERSRCSKKRRPSHTHSSGGVSNSHPVKDTADTSQSAPEGRRRSEPRQPD